MANPWTPERDAALAADLGKLVPEHDTYWGMPLAGWVAADWRDLRAAWQAAEARCAELYATVRDAEVRAGQLQLDEIRERRAAATPDDVTWLILALEGEQGARADYEGQALKYRRERDEARGALDALALAREQDREDLDSATATIARLQERIALVEAEVKPLARVAALEAVLAEPDEELTWRLACLAGAPAHAMDGSQRVLLVRRVLADLRQRAGTPTPRPGLTRPALADGELRALMDLLMVSDPSPLTAAQDKALTDLADREARARGYDAWVVAYHEMPRAG